MRTRAITAMATFAVLVGVGACGSGSENAGGTSGGDVGATGAAGSDAGLTGAGTTGTGPAVSGAAGAATTGGPADSVRRLDSMRTDSINRATRRP